MQAVTQSDTLAENLSYRKIRKWNFIREITQADLISHFRDTSLSENRKGVQQCYEITELTFQPWKPFDFLFA